jgi:hypothetical protein
MVGEAAMTSGPRSQCDTCTRFRSPFSFARDERPKGPVCEAFPDGIPKRVFMNGVDHRYAVAGDGGVRWESDGEDFPEWAFLDQHVGRGD